MSVEAMVASLGAPPIIGPAVTSDGIEFDYDALVAEPLRSPIPQQPEGLPGELVLDAPRICDGLISVGKVASTLGWVSGEGVSYTLRPEDRAVILRPQDIFRLDEPHLTIEFRDDGETTIDSKRRLRLPPAVLMSLSLRPDGDQVFVWGLKTARPLGGHKPTRRSGGNPWIVLLRHPREVTPPSMEAWVSW